MASKSGSYQRMFPRSPKLRDGDVEPTIHDYMPINVKNKNEGAFGKVYQVREKKTDAIYAMKIISKSRVREYQMVEEIRREIRILYQLSHRNIIKMHDHFEDKANVYLVMEWVGGGDLYKRLCKKKVLAESEAAAIIRQLVLALEYLHSLNPPLIHRDIKPENILMSGDEIKLIDFGWSNFIVDNKKRETLAGTPAYLPPEMIDGLPHDQRLDLWNVGVLTFELLTGYPPFSSPGQTEHDLHRNILKIAVKYPSSFPADAKDLVSKLLKRNPAQRLPLDEIKSHPWLTKFYPDRESFHQKLPLKRDLIPANIGDDDPIVIEEQPEDEEESKNPIQESLEKLKSTVDNVLSSTTKKDETLKAFNEWLQTKLTNSSTQTSALDSGNADVAKLRREKAFLENSKSELQRQVNLQKQEIQKLNEQLVKKEADLKDVERQLTDQTDMVESLKQCLGEANMEIVKGRN